MNEEYIFVSFTKDATKEITAIYNSNPVFLQHHLGVQQIEEAFIMKEQEEMKDAGFQTVLIYDSNNHMIGLCDVRIGKETYLSLMMLDGKRKGQGVGREVYAKLEEHFVANGTQSIRIDVVNSYEESPYGFWFKLGFQPIEPIAFEWCGKKLNAIVMKKKAGSC